jgi:hypothetical protein
VLRVENGKAQDSLSMPTLVPYVEDNASGDESTLQAAVKRPATPCTNGWTVTPAMRVLNNGQENELSKSENTISSKSEASLTDSPKKLTKVTDSPKMLHKLNGLDLNTQNRKNSPKTAKDILRKVNKPLFSSNENVNVKRSYDVESSSVAEVSNCFIVSVLILENLPNVLRILFTSPVLYIDHLAYFFFQLLSYILILSILTKYSACRQKLCYTSDLVRYATYNITVKPLYYVHTRDRKCTSYRSMQMC